MQENCGMCDVRKGMFVVSQLLHCQGTLCYFFSFLILDVTFPDQIFVHCANVRRINRRQLLMKRTQ
jgi:hypothetical protein